LTFRFARKTAAPQTQPVLLLTSLFLSLFHLQSSWITAKDGGGLSNDPGASRIPGAFARYPPASGQYPRPPCPNCPDAAISRVFLYVPGDVVLEISVLPYGLFIPDSHWSVLSEAFFFCC
jgi:hypothetical protein